MDNFIDNFEHHRGYEPSVDAWRNLTDHDLTFVSGPNETTYEPDTIVGEVFAKSTYHTRPVIVGGSYPVDTWQTSRLGDSDLPPVCETSFVNYFVHKAVFDQNPDRKDIFYAHTIKKGKKNIVDYIERH